MIGEPALMLLDEPSEGIQPSIVQEIAGHIRRINAEAGMTVLFVEQNLDLIVSLADRGLVMDKGRIVATPRRIGDPFPRRGEALPGAVNLERNEHGLDRTVADGAEGRRRGQGRRPAHDSPVEDQGKYHYVYGPYVDAGAAR